MTKKRRILLISAVVVAVVLIVLGVFAYRVLAVDEIPDHLEEPLDPALLVIEGVGEQPDLRVTEHRGETVILAFVSIPSFRSDEGRVINRALSRWEIPETTKSYMVFDAEGLEAFKEKAGEMSERFSREMRFPIYGDFKGTFRNIFKMPRGHQGIVILDPEGAVAFRHSGPIDEGPVLDEIQERIGASEPPPGPPVPDFAAAGFSDERCAERPCMFVFLGHSVPLKTIPWVEGGLEGEDEELWEEASKPAIRNASLVTGLHLFRDPDGDDDDDDDERPPLPEPGAAPHGLLVGSTPGVELARGWQQVDAAAELRTTFGIAADESAIVVLTEGRVEFQRSGVVPFYEMGRVSDLLGIEMERGDD